MSNPQMSVQVQVFKYDKIIIRTKNPSVIIHYSTGIIFSFKKSFFPQIL